MWKYLTIIAALVLMMPSAATVNQNSAPLITVIEVVGPIGPTTASYIQRAIDESIEMGAEMLIIELDTPGGLLESTKHIVQSMLASNLPVVVYVSPMGASAGSAGTFITLASHVAAMAPGTNIGAATPVQMGGGEAPDDSYRQKVINYAESYIETIADQRKRNVEWAKSAVRDGASITETRALELEVIEIIADNRAHLIDQLDGWELDDRSLNTAGYTVTEIEMTLAERALRFLFRPEVMFILMIIAIYGIIGELSNPGAIVPGVTGFVALILLLYASASMPVNTAGYILIVLAIILFVSEAFTPTFGLLTATGAVAFVIGALMVFDDFAPGYELSWGYIIPATILTVGFFVFVVSAGLKAQFRKTKTGREGMPGRVAEVVNPINGGHGYVMLDGELWDAVSDDSLKKGDLCEILEIKGLTLTVKKLNKGGPDEQRT
ncbi:MAG: nodulation protein NfeD [Balneolaceae bacterium]|nr:MAG: nodulation protein NfeD [Balneolaceae bacterium]